MNLINWANPTQKKYSFQWAHYLLSSFPPFLSFSLGKQMKPLCVDKMTSYNHETPYHSLDQIAKDKHIPINYNCYSVICRFIHKGLSFLSCFNLWVQSLFFPFAFPKLQISQSFIIMMKLDSLLIRMYWFHSYPLFVMMLVNYTQCYLRRHLRTIFIIQYSWNDRWHLISWSKTMRIHKNNTYKMIQFCNFTFEENWKI